MIDDWPTRVSVWIAVLCYGVSTMTFLRGRVALARWIFLVGLLAYLSHVLIAFHLHHQWSHAIALESTIARTKEVTGINTQSGLFVNYLFSLVWLVETLWWWRVGDKKYASRSRAWWGAIQAFFLFMIVNGAVVFAQGPARWLGVVVVVGVIGCWIHQSKHTNDVPSH